MQLKTWQKVVVAIVVPGGTIAGVYWLVKKYWLTPTPQPTAEDTAAAKAKQYADDLKQKALNLKNNLSKKATSGRGASHIEDVVAGKG